MITIKTIIVEDEKVGMTNLIGKLKRNCPNIQVIATCETGEEAIETIHKHQPQLVFLDVRLGSMTGFDVLDRLQHIQFDIIFTTDYNNYAIKAIKADALDYLLKPISDKELITAVNKAWWKIQQKEQNLQRISVRISDGWRFIPVPDILYCKADDNCSWLHLDNKKPLLVTHHLLDMDRKLPASQFYRIHRTYTVNLEYVESFSREDGGYVVMKDGAKLPVSTPRRGGFLDRFDR